MRGRTFFRIMMDNLFVNNVLCKALLSLVNFCNEQTYYGQKKLKFLKKMPLNNIKDNNLYDKRFIFSNTRNSGVNYK